MILFNSLVEAKVYRTNQAYSLPCGLKNKLNGNLVTVLSKSLDGTLEFFKSPYIKTTNYRRYYIDRINRYIILGQTMKSKNDMKLIMDEKIKPSGLQVSVISTPNQAKDYNLIYELGQFDHMIDVNKKIEAKSVLIRSSLKVQYLINKLKSLDSQFIHPNKYLYIPVDEYITNPKDSTIFTKLVFKDNDVIEICNSILTAPEDFKQLSDWTLVFMNINELFYIHCNNITEETGLNIQKLFKMFKTRRGVEGEVLGDDKDDSLTSDDVVNKQDDTSLEDDDVEEPVNTPDTEEEQNSSLDEENKGAMINNHLEIKTSGTDLTERSMKNINEKVKAVQATDNIVIDPKSVDQANELLNHPVVKATIAKELQSIMAPQSTARLAREKKLKDEMGQLRVNNLTIDEIQLAAKQKTISPKIIKADVINENMKKIKFANFDKEYNNKLMTSDILNVLMSFGNMDRPLNLISVNTEDTSTNMDKLTTYTCVYEDEKGKRHNLTFDTPKFIDNKFIHLNKSDKIFITQVITLPVTKTGPDTVQLASNYNKMFMTRFGTSLSPKITKFHKAIPDISFNIIHPIRGNSNKANKSYMTTLEYDELASKYLMLKLHRGDIILYFSQPEIYRLCEEYKLKFNPDKEQPFGIDYTNPKELKLITIDVNTDKVTGTEISPIDFIIKEISSVMEGFNDNFVKLSAGKRFIYTRVKVMAKNVPIVLLLSFLEGLEPLLNKAKIPYQFTEKRPMLKGADVVGKGIIEFKDGYLTYDLYPFTNSLLMNGFSEIPTKEFEFLQFSGRDIYFDLFDMIYGRRNIGTAFQNFNQLFIDPITKEILEDHNLPTNFVDLMLYANTLLENNAYDYDSDLKNYRVRTNELVSAHLYKVLSTAYESYRSTADNKNPQKFSIRRNALISDMMASQIVEEYSNINPIAEIERMRSTSPKGLGGRNLDRAFKLASRSYNGTMMGVFAQSSPISSNIGISRRLSLDPQVTSLRGYLKPGTPEELAGLSSTNIASGAELLLNSCITKDDPSRVSMSSTQSGHSVSTIDSDPPLWGTGYDKVLAHTISDKFAFKAKQDGVIKSINDDLGIMILQYVDGTSDVVDLRNKQEKNAGGGFHITNRLIASKLEGHKFEEGEIVACNEDFFLSDPNTSDVIFKSGPSARVASIHGSSVFEDSTLLTESLARRMSTYVTHQKDIALGKNSNIYHMVKIGDKVKVGDPLLIFDESYEDEYLNKLLAKMNEKVMNEIKESGQTPIKSHYNGEIVDIKIYYSVPKEELSDTLKDIVVEHESKILERNKIFKDIGIDSKDLTSLAEATEVSKITNGKLKGTKMLTNQVLIEFYIRVLDKFSQGDKLTFSVALKGIAMSVIPEGKEPYLASDPSKKIDALFSLTGMFSRMCNSVNISIGVNTIVLTMEERVKEVYEKHFGKIEDKKEE